MKAGSKFKFSGVGDEIEGGMQDLHFIIEEVSLRFQMLDFKSFSRYIDNSNMMFVPNRNLMTVLLGKVMILLQRLI